MAIIGIGTDRVVVERIRISMERFGDRFIQRVYTRHEYEQARGRGDLARRLAMLFAAKEAVAKALGTGFCQGVTPRLIETIHQATGKPECVLHGVAEAAANRLGIESVHISLTDDDGIAMAFAVAEAA